MISIQYYCDVLDFKEFFIRSCPVEKKYETHKVWTQWLIRNLCMIPHNYHVIPSKTVIGDTDIISHLVCLGLNKRQALTFYVTVIKKVLSLYDTYNEYKCNMDLSDVQMMDIRHCQTHNMMHTYSVNDIYIKFDDTHHQALINRYQGDPHYLNFCLFEMGFNYFVLEGHSFQWCVPPNAMAVLNQYLSVNVELFASPINVSLPNYYSLFMIDKYFGATGNFFNLCIDDINDGSYEINPPFIDNLFIRSSDMVISWLEQKQADKRDLLFVYIMPDWIDSEGYIRLVNSRFLVDEIILKEKEHYYYQSHNNKLIMSSFETHIIVVGTDLSRSKWTTNVRSLFISQFCRW